MASQVFASRCSKNGKPFNPMLADHGVDRVEVPGWRRGANAAARTARGLAPLSASNSFSCQWEAPRQNGSGRKIVLPAITEFTAGADASGPRPRRRERVRRAEAEQGAGQRSGPWNRPGGL